MSVLTQRTSKPNNYANSQTTQNKIETAPRIVESASVDENGKTNWKDYFGSSDFQEYSQKGNAIQNPTFDGANRGMSVGNWRPFADQVNNMVTYSRANVNKIALGAANSSNVVGDLKYSQMTDDEVNMYNYLLAKENEGLLAKGTSQSFLNDIDQTLLQREGKKSGEAIAEMIKGDNIGEKIGGSILGIGTAYGSGLTGAVSGIKQVGNKKPVEDKALTYTGQSLRENLQDIGKQTKSGNSMSQAIFDFSSSLGNMAPSIAAGTFLGPVAGAATIGLSSGGSAKKQALEEGKTLGEAKAYGALVGAAEAGLGYLLGGIDAVGGKITKGLSKKASNSILKALEKASPALAKAAAYTGTKLIKANGEFNEEYLQDILDPIFRNIVFDENNKIKIFSEDAVYSGILGALNSIILGVGGDIATHNSRKNAPSPNTTNQNASPSTEVQQPTQPVESQPSHQNIPNPFVSAGLTKDVNLEEGKPKEQIPNPFVTAGLTKDVEFNPETAPQAEQTSINPTTDVIAEQPQTSNDSVTSNNPRQIYYRIEAIDIKGGKTGYIVSQSFDPEFRTSIPVNPKKVTNGKRFFNTKESAQNFVNTLPKFEEISQVNPSNNDINNVQQNGGIENGQNIATNNVGSRTENDGFIKIESNATAKRQLADFSSKEVNTAFESAVKNEQTPGRRVIRFNNGESNINYAISYKEVSPENYTQEIKDSLVVLNSLGIPNFVYDGDYKVIADRGNGVETEVGGRNTLGATFAGAAVGMKQGNDGALNTAYHESFHYLLRGNAKGVIEYANKIIANFNENSKFFKEFYQEKKRQYKLKTGKFEGYKTFKFDDSNYNSFEDKPKLYNELVAYITGNFFGNSYEQLLNRERLIKDVECFNACKELFLNNQVSNSSIENAAKQTTAQIQQSQSTVTVEEARYSDSLNTTMPFTKERQQATGYTPEQYREIFKYSPVSEADSLNKAKSLLFDDAGNFIGDFNPTEFSNIISALNSEATWTGIEIDMGHLIEQQLMAKAQNSAADMSAYIDWLGQLRRIKTESGRTLQANSKWSTRGNLDGANGRSKAWKLINDNPKLNQQAKQELFGKILNLSNQVKQNASNDAGLKQIILDVANERGQLNTIFGNKSALLERLVNKSLDSMTNEQLRQFAYNSVSALAEDVKPRDIGQIVKSVQVLNMLSSPTTATTNIASNTTFYGLDSLSMKAANILDKVISNRTGTRSIANETVLSNQTKDAAIKGMLNSIAEITLGVDMGSDNRYGVSKGTFRANGGTLEKIMHKIETASGYALNATDEFYKGAARSTEADIQAAIDRGEIKTDDANYAKNMANELALYRTFQNDSKLAAILGTVHDALNIVGIGDSGKRIAGQKVGKFGVGDLVSPFTKIAANLAQVAIDYSPVKAIKGTYEIVKTCADASANPTMQAKAVTDTARGITGTAIAIVFAGLAQAGIIKRADDEDEDVNKLNAAEGRQGTQINLSAFERWIKNGFKGNVEWQYGDQLVDLSRLEPFNFMVNLGLTANENDEDKEAVVSMFTPGVNASAIIDAMADLPVAESIGGLAKDVLKYNKPIGESLTTSVGRTAISSVTPNILASYAKATDDKKRSITSGDTVGEQLTDYAKRRIPGLRETLPTTVDVNGNEQEESGFAASMISPFFPNTYTQSDVSKEMERVRSETGKADFYPTTRSQREVKYTKDGVEHVKRLDYEARQKFQKLNNQTQNREMVKLMKTGYYNEATDEEKAMMLKKCYDYAYGIAKESVLGKDAVDDWILDIKDGKIDLPNYCQYLIEINSIKGDKDANGNTISGSEKAKKLQAINSLDVSNETKDLFFKMAYPKGNYADTGWNQGKANASSNFWKARGKS